MEQIIFKEQQSCNEDGLIAHIQDNARHHIENSGNTVYCVVYHSASRIVNGDTILEVVQCIDAIINNKGWDCFDTNEQIIQNVCNICMVDRALLKVLGI